MHQTFPVDSVVSLAHLVQSLITVNHNHFRGLEGFALCQFPAEAFRIDSHHHTGHIKSRNLYLSQMVAAIYQAEAIYFSLIFCCVWTFQCKERVLFCTAAGTVQALDALDTHLQSSGFHITFSCPAAGQMYHLIIHIIIFYTGTHDLIQNDLLASFMADLCISCNYRIIFIDRIRKNQVSIHHCIVKSDFEGLCLIFIFHISGWQWKNVLLSVTDFMGCIGKVHDAASVFLYNGQCWASIITGSVSREFLFCILHGKDARFWNIDGHLGTHTLFMKVGKIFPVVNSLSII